VTAAHLLYRDWGELGDAAWLREVSLRLVE
jgi:hypothetical protein